MIISVFKNGHISFGEDHSYTPPKTEEGITTPAKGHPDCLFSREIDYNEDTQSIRYDSNIEDIIIEDLPPPPEKTVPQIRREIGDKILERAFDNNPHAQIADLTSAVLGLSYILVQIAGKEPVQQAVGNLIPSIKSASEVRVAEGLSPYDVSWLE